MKRMVRVISLLVGMAFSVTTLLTGCGNKDSGQVTGQTSAQASGQNTSAANSNGVDTSKEVNLVMYLVGDKQPDADMVYTEVNKKLKEDINTTLEVKYIPWADFSTKYNLIFASGEDFDCVYAGDWLGYAQQATKHGFLDIDLEMVKKCAPDYYAVIPKESWEQVKVKSKINLLPYMHKQFSTHYMVNLRGDLREKYNLPKLTNLDSLENYMFAVAKNETGIKALDGNIDTIRNFMVQQYYAQPNNLRAIISDPQQIFFEKMDDKSGKIVNVLEDPAYLAMLKKAKTFADSGIWAKEILAQKTTNDQAYTAGKSAMNTTHIETSMLNYNNLTKAHPDWKPEYYDLQPDKLRAVTSAAHGGIGIHATSNNPERVMMMMNLFATKKDYYDLTTYGIEGKHYTPVGDNKLKSTEEGIKNFVPKQNCPWGWERTEFIRYPDTLPDELINMENSWTEKGLVSKSALISFVFDDTKVKNEIAACSNLIKTEGYILLTGLSKDPEADLNKYKEDMKKAGLDKVQQELQNQVNDFLAKNK